MDNKQIKKIFIFLIVIEIMYWIFIIAHRGLWVDSYFSNDMNDTGMDYFNMLKISVNKNPYYLNSNYPAMCFFFLKILYHIMPIDYADDLNSFELRSYMPAQIGYIMFSLLCIVIIWEFSKIIFGDTKQNCYLCAISIILSGPFLFALERGNMIILSVAFLMVFIAFYDSDNWRLRMVAYIMLGLSASLKIYPALFGLILFRKKEKKFKEIIITIFIGFLIFLMPFLFLDNGKSLKYMVNGILISSGEQSNLGMNYNFSFFNLQKIMSSLIFNDLSYQPINSIIIPILICLFIFTLSKEKWKQLFAISLLCVWIPKFSYTYCLLLFILPFILYCRDNKNKGVLTMIYNIFFIVILAPSALPIVKNSDIENAKFPLTYSTIIINICIAFFAILIVFEILFSLIIKADKKNI